MTSEPVDWVRPVAPIWACMVCGQWRPDVLTSVNERPLQYQLWGKPLIFNVVYCNDRAACIEAAHADGPWAGGKPPGPLPAEWSRHLTRPDQRAAEKVAELLRAGAVIRRGASDALDREWATWQPPARVQPDTDPPQGPEPC